MKKLLLTSALVAVCAGAFAQGKVTFVNDGASLVVLTTDTGGVLAADKALAGQVVGNQVALPSGKTLVAGLYGGTSSSSLFLYSTLPLTDAATPGGVIAPTHWVLNANAATGASAIPGIASGTPITASTPWFQVAVWDASFGSYAAAVGQGYAGKGAPFQFNPGPSLLYPNIAPTSANSTWTEGNIILSVPEPSTFALAGLGAAALMIFRRRK